jgi:hypothetical protein
MQQQSGMHQPKGGNKWTLGLTIIGASLFLLLLTIFSNQGFIGLISGIGCLGVLAFGLLIPISLVAILLTSSDPRGRLLGDHHRTQSQEQRQAYRAAQVIDQAPSHIDGIGVLGAAISGNLFWCRGHWLLLPEPELALHGVIVGGSGTGKTVSLLRLAYIAATCYGYRVFFLDAKGDRQTAAQFLAMMRGAGINALKMFPRQRYNGWKGNASAIVNRLMAVETFSESYYKAVSKRVLTLVCNDQAGPPRSSQQFFSRFNDDLKDQAKLSSRDLAGVELRYRAFFDALGGKLDAGWSWEDADAAYVLLDGLSLKEEAASLGRYFIEDFAHYAANRKRPGRDLLIIDEYSALSTGADAANLVERLRSYGCAVILSSQSYAGLGKPQDAERILDAANWLLLHRSAAPERLTHRAGTQKAIREQYQVGGGLSLSERIHGDRGNVRLEEEDTVHPDQARRLGVGEAILIAHGGYIKARVARPPEPDPAKVQSARQWIESAPASAQQHQARQIPQQQQPPPETI